MIVGRRGSGKTSLTKYFNFQQRYKNAHSIDVDEPVIYQNIIQKFGANAYLYPDMVINDVIKIWEFLIWSLIFGEFAEYDPIINKACIAAGIKGKPLLFLRDVVSGLLQKYVDENGRVLDSLSDQLTANWFLRAQDKVTEFTHTEPIIIAIDTFDKEWPAVQEECCALHLDRPYSHAGLPPVATFPG